MSLPLYIVCQRPDCEQLREVRKPSEQRIGKYCSIRCAALATQNLRREGQRRGGQHSARNRRRQVLARVQRLTPLAAFQVGYKIGLESKLRQIRKRYVLTKRTAAAARPQSTGYKFHAR